MIIESIFEFKLDEADNAILEDLRAEENVSAEEHLAHAEVFENTEAEREAVICRDFPRIGVAVDRGLVRTGNDTDRVVRNDRALRALGEVTRHYDSLEAVEAFDDALLNGLAGAVDIAVEQGKQVAEISRIEGENTLVGIDAVIVADLQETGEQSLCRRHRGGQLDVGRVNHAVDFLVRGVGKNVGDGLGAVAEEVDVRLAGFDVVEADGLDVMLIERDNDAVDFVRAAAPVVRRLVKLGRRGESVNRNLNARERTVGSRSEVVGEILQGSHVLLEAENSRLGSNFNL